MAGFSTPTARADSTLLTVEQVRQLTPEQADKRYPVRLRGVITFSDWKADGGFFLQDQTAGIYIHSDTDPDALTGEDVELEGTTAPGDFVPLVQLTKLRKLGPAALPTPEKVSYEQLATGKEDSQWVEISGLVRSALLSTKDRTRVDVLVNGQRLTALVGHLDVAAADGLICANVRVQGICRTRFNRKRQLRAPFLSVGSVSNFVVEGPLPGQPVEVPLQSLLQFNSEGYYGRRVEVRGVVTEQKGNSIFIQENGAGLYVKSQQSTPTIPGDIVKVVGFPVLGQIAPVLEDAIFHRIGHSAPPAPVPVAINQLLVQDYDAILVRLRGRLINRVERLDEEVLVLEAANLILSAHLDKSQRTERISQLQNGSELELTGVCLPQPVENWNPSLPNQPESFQLLLRSAADVNVLSYPSWWTLSRLLWMLGALSLVLLAGFGWVFVLDRRVRAQTTIIQQKIQREAVLEERTRIAREFHDTLEQELAAITIQLDTVSAQFDSAPSVARRLLDLARNMSRRSLVEARRSVWDLRSHLLENSNLVTALSEVVKLMATARTSIAVQTSGGLRKLPAQMENNLLRIAQEALTNALKHAEATQITVHLNYAPAGICLRIRDNGVGFDTKSHATIYGGHFGLLDMTERAEKIGGVFTMRSTSGQGTEITVAVMENGASVPSENTGTPESNPEEKASAA
ncbi:MAG TPA: sensor histidine kinase [Candidatus Saccharimonadales bacterium]|nr:sensor histidine kinase [Candidatus Saccharimonadales bacterium]